MYYIKYTLVSKVPTKLGLKYTYIIMYVYFTTRPIIDPDDYEI